METSQQLKLACASLEKILLEKNWNENQFEFSYAPRDVSLYEVKTLGRVSPKTKLQVQDLLVACQRLKIKHYPFSMGNNWAFGGQLPFCSDALLIDLSQINSIQDYNSEFGTVRIEPGVTQGQLCTFLKTQKSRFFLDVTGSGAETSVLGNTLERGIAYNSLRAEQVIALEVALPNGQIIQSGFSEFPNCKVTGLYGHGLGPDLRGLFLQSNLGVVLSLTLRLHPIPKKRLSFRINVKESKLGAFVESISELKRQGILNCIVHIADPIRLRSTLEPILRSDSHFSKSEVHRLLKPFDITPEKELIWSAIGSVTGDPAMVKVKKKLVIKNLRAFGKVDFFDETLIQRIFPFLGWGPLKSFQNFLRATKSLRGFVEGRASSEAIKMLFWNPKSEDSLSGIDEIPPDVTKTKVGTLFCVPLAPMNEEGTRLLIGTLRDFSKEHSLLVGATLNTLSAEVLEAVISFHFESKTKEKNHELFLRLNQKLLESGAFPYRMNPKLMNSSWAAVPHQALTKKIKDVLDPEGLLSPGHYIEP